MRYRASWCKIAVILMLMAAIAVGYDAYAWREVVVMSNQASAMRQQLGSLRAVGDVEGLRREVAMLEAALAEARRAQRVGVDEMDNVDLLIRAAGESKVEIVNLLRPDVREGDESQITYRLCVRADIDKLMVFLKRLEEAGLHRVVIDRLAAKRRGEVWEANLEVTSYFKPQGLAAIGDASSK